jgi:pinin/SDK/memA/ protein conserved region
VILCRQIQVPAKEQTLDTDTDATMQDAPQVAAPEAVAPKKRPRLDLTIGPRERKRGKSMFGLLVGTLNKAKTEDEARNASEAVRNQTSTRDYDKADPYCSGKKKTID